MTTPATDRGQKITLIKERSSGTFSRVYLAEATGAGGISRLVAVKVLREKWAQAEEFLNRTKDEARMLAQLRHPGIVRVEDLVALDGNLAIVMEFVNGIDLQQLVDALKKRGEQLPRRTVYLLIQRIASALDAAYRKAPYGRTQPIRVVHRDIKPSNIMLTPEGELKVLDFGTARGSFEDRSAKTTMFRFGSLKYMSPERRLGDRGDHPGDVYAMGLMLIELLNGRWLPLMPEPPDHDQAIAEAIEAIADTGMPDQEWDTAARQVIGQMCATEPEDRPNAEKVVKFMRAFADQASGASLEGFCADVVEPISAELFPEQSTESGVLAGTQLIIASPAEAPASPVADEAAAEAPSPSIPPTPVAQTPSSRRPVAQAPVDPADAGGDAGRPAPPPAPVVTAPSIPPTPTPAAPVTPVPVAPVISGPVLPPAAPPPSRPRPPKVEPAETNTAPKQDKSLVVVLAAAVALGFLVTLAGGVAMVLHLRGEKTTVEAPPAEAGGSLEALAEDPPVEGGVAVTVTVTGEAKVQWIKLNQGETTTLKGDDGGLKGSIAPGEYELAVKVIGRPAATVPITVGDDGLGLTCALDKAGKGACEGGAAPLTLSPG
ncbi:MAG: protein kinase [Deltaproteobacteria bacterium]|nr:protein kinase [Deltaproteobacteria bacterium]